MTEATPLAASPIVAFLPVTDAPAALAYYRDLLGLTLVEDQSPFALVFDANGTMLRVTPVGPFTPQRFTILGWHVADIDSSVAALTAAGVSFNRYPGLNDATPLPIWTAPNGARIAWFTDPFGNVLGLTQF
jgi:catechol 2,3-dioxygenase-like lactoylglutathione lyase family enzyme